MSMESAPIYFELSWSVLSTIGIGNFLFGSLICCIIGFSQLSIIPLITSVATAIANGLCFYAYYAYGVPTKNQAAAAVFADLFWLIQEAGLSFYSFLILRRVLRGRRWIVFSSLFWTILTITVSLRVMIAVTRAKFILSHDKSLQDLVNNAHIGYFTSIALLECVSSYFLLSMFASARTTSLKAAIKTGLVRYLMRSTEVRLALLSILGVMRAITYSFQTTAQSASNTAGQLDRFAYTLECLFPFVMFIDMLASRIAFTDQSGNTSRVNTQAGRTNARNLASNANKALSYVEPESETVIKIQGGGNRAHRNSSQEQIIEPGLSEMTTSEAGIEEVNPRRGISKTVDFEMQESYRPPR